MPAISKTSPRGLDALPARGQFTPREWDGYLYEVRAERIFLSR